MCLHAPVGLVGLVMMRVGASLRGMRAACSDADRVCACDCCLVAYWWTRCRWRDDVRPSVVYLARRMMAAAGGKCASTRAGGRRGGGGGGGGGAGVGGGGGMDVGEGLIQQWTVGVGYDGSIGDVEVEFGRMKGLDGGSFAANVLQFDINW